jgi:cell division protease FtsH
LRAAEQLALDDVSTGAQDDLERATALAQRMVCRFGMSGTLGARTYGHPIESPHLAGPSFEERDFSDETARAIDAEVGALVEDERQRAHQILELRRAALTAVAERLLTVETLERAELEELTRPARDVAA